MIKSPTLRNSLIRSHPICSLQDCLKNTTIRSFKILTLNTDMGRNIFSALRISLLIWNQSRKIGLCISCFSKSTIISNTFSLMNACLFIQMIDLSLSSYRILNVKSLRNLNLLSKQALNADICTSFEKEKCSLKTRKTSQQSLIYQNILGSVTIKSSWDVLQILTFGLVKETLF